MPQLMTPWQPQLRTQKEEQLHATFPLGLRNEDGDETMSTAAQDPQLISEDYVKGLGLGIM